MKSALDLIKKARDILDANNVPDYALIDGEVYTKPPERDCAKDYLVWHFGRSVI